MAFKSIVFNSGICLELYKVNLIDRYTAVVYLSFLALSLTIPLLVQLISPLLRRLIGFRYDMFSRTGRLVFAVVAGAYFATASSLFGFQKEKNRVEVWANRLAMDRDISLELQLRAAEAAISEDSVIGALSLLDNSHEMILVIDNGMSDLWKPSGKLFDACASGHLLLVAPWEHRNYGSGINRSRCLAMNDVALAIVEGKFSRTI